MMDDETVPDEYHVPLGARPGYPWVGLVPGTPKLGLWCDTCLLPSRYEIPLYVLGDDGPIRVGTKTGCDGHSA